ncbi:8-oxoguanine DNA glycosylase OGG fold protein [Streptomyces mirabilis]|uniref:8-oxoguanine DNA glycosylase OGG fold protein n=1 Tax=Streptomyces mirabilis TaxID=68239 RepID=UPI00381A4EE4
MKNDVLRARGAADAYWAFNNDQRIPHLGPAFFTKVLYFAGHDTAAARHCPVILDSVVSRALKAEDAVDVSWPGNGWTTDHTGCTWTGCTSTRRPEASSRIKSRQLCSPTVSSWRFERHWCRNVTVLRALRSFVH